MKTRHLTWLLLLLGTTPLLGDILSRDLVLNGSFDEGAAGWDRVWGQVSVAEGQGRGGGWGLRIKDGGAMRTHLIAFAEGIYRYSGWMRTLDVAEGENPYNIAVIQVTAYGKDKKSIRHWDVAAAKGTTEWQQFSGELDLRDLQDARYLQLSCQIWNTTGEARFDDLSLGLPYGGPPVVPSPESELAFAKPYPPPPTEPRVIPAPQMAEWLEGVCVWSGSVPIVIQEDCAEFSPLAVDLLRESLQEACDILLEDAEIVERSSQIRGFIFESPEHFLAQLPRRPRPEKAWRKALPEQGYLLSVSPQTVRIAAGDEAGFLHGVQTFRQLMGPVRSGVVRIPAVRIRDWPDLPWRGMYLSMCYGPGAGAGCDFPLLKRIVRDTLAGHKLNALLLQVDSNMRYSSHPELGGIFEPEELRAFVAYCQSYGIEVIPLIQSFGHNHYFVFGGGKRYVELAEDESTYSVCPSLPESSQIFKDLYDEIIEVFQPRYIHIGCDEVGPIGVCDRCKETPKAELFAMHINTLRDHLHEQGVGTMIWGDYLLDPEAFPDSSYCNGAETWQALDLLARDIVICDWHYKAGVGPHHDYPTTGALMKRGFPVIAVPAVYSRINNATYAQYARRIGLENMFSSVWASIHNWKGIKSSPSYMGGMIHAAEYAWSTAQPALDGPSPYSATERGLFLLRPSLAPGRTGFLIDLASSVNASFEVGKDFLFGRHTVGGVRYRILDPLDREGLWCVGASSDDTLPSVVTDLPVGRPACGLAFLHACLHQGDEDWKAWETVGSYEVVYTDGSTVRIPLVTDLNVARASLKSGKFIYGARRIALSGQPALYSMEWINPRQDLPIHHVNLTVDPDAGIQIYLLALTGIGERGPSDGDREGAAVNLSRTRLEGFAEIVAASNHDGYFTCRGETAPSWYEYATTGEQSVSWKTEAVIEILPEEQVTFVMACGLGSGAGDHPHDVWVNGKQALTIGTPHQKDGHWQGDGATAFFSYRASDQWDSFGFLYLTVDSDYLVPGEPAIIEVKGSASDKKSWFMIHGFTDNIPYDLLHGE